jgi:hypothetical protein
MVFHNRPPDGRTRTARARVVPSLWKRPARKSAPVPAHYGIYRTPIPAECDHSALRLGLLSTEDLDAQTPLDRHIRLMAGRGRIAWQRATGYGRRNHAETAMGRYKHLIGPKLRARTLPGQRGEVAIPVSVLNRMIQTGKPVSVRA